ncbi:MAG: thioredoxin family protein [Chitinophagaceae bacterium]|nr:thioredoxin family protein [Chitinophagaceae bacterium]
MARTTSTMKILGSNAPDFLVLDTISDKQTALADVKGEMATVVMFICNHCPFVLHINEALIQLAHEYRSKEIGFVAISANDIITHPEDAPDKMKAVAEHLGYPFPYLFDETQDIAKAYDAACTPDFFIYDKRLKLVYRGQLDDSRPGNGIPVTGKDIRLVLDCLLSERPVPGEQKPSIGCNIKWK